MSKITPEILASNIAKGVFKPHIYLTNIALAYFQDDTGYMSRRLFPMVPVPISC
ncbi:MAG: hypothetical protein FWD01_04350 [Defluviitaleaceae bacterium]|nr:hypothetical protein [Defluviitaleaceae bacterium]